jgi:hypothetical protein
MKLFRQLISSSYNRCSAKLTCEEIHFKFVTESFAILSTVEAKEGSEVHMGRRTTKGFR